MTVEEKWIKKELEKRVCGGEFDEKVVRNMVEKVLISKDGIAKILITQQKNTCSIY